MNILDIIIAGIIVFGLWRGYRTGFIRTAVALVGWFIALVAATRWADDMAPHLAGYVDSDVLQMGLGFLLIILLVMIVIQIVSFLVKYIVDSLKLTIIDQIAGGVLGAAKNILIVLVLLSVTAPILIKMPFWQTASLAPALMEYAPFAKQITSKTLGQAWQQIDAPDAP